MTRPSVCFVIEDGFPFFNHSVARWTEQMLEAMAPTPVGIVHVTHREWERPPPFVPPEHVAYMGELVYSSRGVSVRGIARHTSRSLGSMRTWERLLLRRSSERFRQGTRLVVPLLRAVADGAGALAPTYHLSEAFRVAAGDGPYGLSPEDLTTSTGAVVALSSLYSDLDVGIGLEVFLDAVVQALTVPLHLLSVCLPPAQLYHAIGTGYGGLVAALAAERHADAKLVVSNPYSCVEQRVLEIHRRHDRLSQLPPREVDQLWLQADMLWHRMVLDRADLVVATHPGDVSQLESLGVGADRLQLVPTGANPVTPRTPRPARAARSTEPILIGLGHSVSREHDVRSFLRCAQVLSRRVDLSRFLVVGSTTVDPAYMAGCREETQHLMLTHLLRFTGAADVAEFVPLLECLVVTSLSNRVPEAVTHAMAHGVPIVAVDTPPLRAALTTERGAAGALFVPPSRSDLLAEAVEKVLAESTIRSTIVAAAQECLTDQCQRGSLLTRYARLFTELSQVSIA